jgi:hypothetical protein
MGCDSKDLIHPEYPLPNGDMVISRHRPDHSVVPSILRPARAGKPMASGDECVALERRGDGSYEVTGSYVHGARGAGPAQVATEEYRCGWERTFTARGGDA